MTHRAAAHLHVGDLAYVPRPKRLVEDGSVLEHALHRLYMGYIPILYRLIKTSGFLITYFAGEHLVHICY